MDGDSLNKIFENRKNLEKIEELRGAASSEPPSPAPPKEVELDPFQGTYVMATRPDEQTRAHPGVCAPHSSHFAACLPADTFERLEHDTERMLQLTRGVREKVAVLFADIRGFSYISGMLPPDRSFKLLNIFHSEMIKIMRDEHGAFIHAITGDCLVACFGLPYPVDCSMRAVRAAGAALAQLPSINRSLEENGLPAISVGIGINTGIVNAGFVNTDRGISAFSLIGETVNIASKLENTALRGEIIIGETTRDEVAAQIAALEHPEKVTITGADGHVKTFSGFVVR